MHLDPAAEETGIGNTRRLPRRGQRRHLRRHVVDEEAENAGLRRDVEKLREHRHPEMRMRPDRLARVRR